MIGNTKNPVLEAAYLFYYGSDLGLIADVQEDARLKERLESVIGDALIVANTAKFDVFNALTLMDNVPILQDLKVRFSRLSLSVDVLKPLNWQFGIGDGLLNFYLYNWRTAPLAGMNAEGGVSPGRGVGVVML